MGTRLKQSSIVVVGLLVLLTPAFYLAWSKSLFQRTPNVCRHNRLSISPNSSHNINGFVERNKCCDAIDGKKLEQVCSYDNSEPKQSPSVPGCNCMDYFYCKLVVVSSISSNHLSEATEMIVSVQRYMPSTRLIMYSLGLTSGEMELLRSYCNVELRIFDFDKYPTLAYSKNHLRTFGWKPVVVKEVSEQYEVVMYFDSSVRLNGPIDARVFKYFQSSPAFFAGPWWGNQCVRSNRPIVSFTHDTTLKYLFPKKSQDLTSLRKELAVWGHLQAGCWIMWLNSDMKERLLDNWVDCALHEQCMAPKEADIDGCVILAKMIFTDYVSEGKYTGCHRYDQSALNLLLFREFGPEAAVNICHEFVFKLLVVQRQSNLLFYIFLGVILSLVLIIIFVNWYFS